MSTPIRINPRFRAYGRARIDIAQRAQSRADWERLWKPPAYDFPFEWGNHWKQCIEYRVNDFAAEVGFFIDVLAFPVNAFDPDYAMFTSPNGEFYFAVVAAPEASATPPDAIRLQFMIANLNETVKELETRGVVFTQQPQPCEPGSKFHIATCHTPHGIAVDLWGVIELQRSRYVYHPARPFGEGT